MKGTRLNLPSIIASIGGIGMKGLLEKSSTTGPALVGQKNDDDLFIMISLCLPVMFVSHLAHFVKICQFVLRQVSCCVKQDISKTFLPFIK